MAKGRHDDDVDSDERGRTRLRLAGKALEQLDEAAHRTGGACEHGTVLGLLCQPPQCTRRMLLCAGVALAYGEHERLDGFCLGNEVAVGRLRPGELRQDGGGRLARLGQIGLKQQRHLQAEGVQRQSEGVQRQAEGVQRQSEGVLRQSEGVQRQSEGVLRQSEGV